MALPVEEMTAAFTAALQAAKARSVSVKLPKFTDWDVDLWFDQADACFALARITQQRTKYNHVLSILDASITVRVASYISNPSDVNEYDGLRLALSRAFGKSLPERYREAMDMRLGDTQPSQLMEKLGRLYQLMFLDKMPSHIRCMLDQLDHLSNTDLAEKADSLLAIGKASRDPRSTLLVQPDTENLHASGEPSTIAAVQSNHNHVYHTIDEYNICLPHFRYANKARKCYPKCQFKNMTKASLPFSGRLSSPKGEKKRFANVVLPEPFSSATDLNIKLPPGFHDQSQRQAVVIYDKVNQLDFVVDSGAAYNLIPANQDERKLTPDSSLFSTANGMALKCYGQRELTLAFGLGKAFKHLFLCVTFGSLCLAMIAYYLTPCMWMLWVIVLLMPLHSHLLTVLVAMCGLSISHQASEP